MRKAVKVLSVVLILASVFGLVGGGLALKDALGSKAYWEAASSGGDSIGMLEDGLNQLKENEQTYLDGREALEAGKLAYEEGQTALEEGKAQLEDGAKQLEEGKAKLEDGAKQLEEGKAKLEEAAKQLEEGKAKLAAGQREYDAGQQQLNAAAAQLAEGKKTLDEKEAEYAAGVKNLEQAKSLLEGLGQLQQGFATWQQGYNGLKSFQQAAAAQGTTLPDPSAANAEVYDAAIAQTKEKVETGLGYCDQLDTLKAQKQQLEDAIAQMKAAGQDTTELEAQLAQVNAGIAQIEAGLGGQTRESLTQQKAMLDQLTGVPQAVAQGQQQLAAGTKTAVTGILSNEDMAQKLVAASGMSEDELKATIEALPSMDYATFDATMTKMMKLADKLVNSEGGLLDQITAGQQQLDEGRKQLDEGWAAYNAGMAEYEAGKAKLAAAKKQLDEGKAQLAEGQKQYDEGVKLLEEKTAEYEAGVKLLEEKTAEYEAGVKTLEEGEETLKAAEQQIADGEAQLAVFEDGRDQVIDGLNQAMAMETYPGIDSIQDRLGDDFSFMKNDTDLDIDKGLEVVGAARAFASDTTDAVTKEITSKAVGAILTLVGSVIAAVAGVLGLLGKKTKVSGVMALVGAAAAAVGVILSLNAGMTFSEIAGAAAPTLFTAAGASTAVAGVAQSVPAIMAKPAVPKA